MTASMSLTYGRTLHASVQPAKFLQSQGAQLNLILTNSKLNLLLGILTLGPDLSLPFFTTAELCKHRWRGAVVSWRVTFSNPHP